MHESPLFAYNGFGARVSKTDSAGSTTYLRNGTSVVAPVVADSGATYTPGISERRETESRFYHGDIKNFVEQTNASGQIASSQQYDAFGNPVSSTGTWSGPFAYCGRFGYQSDSDTSLSLLGHRYYDSTTGRFLSRDPIKDGRNWYGYCGNNPVTFADPTGLIAPLIVGLGVAALAGAIVGALVGALFAPSGEKLAAAGQGALYGAIGGIVGSLIGVPVAAYLMGVGIPGWLAGMIGGGVGGFFAGIADEATGVALGWDDEFEWSNVGASAGLGALSGGLLLRPGNGPMQNVVRYTNAPEGIPQGSWVQVGKPGIGTRLMSGKLGAAHAVTVRVPGEALSWPSGVEWFKGVIGQRKYLGPSIPPTPFKSPMPFQ